MSIQGFNVYGEVERYDFNSLDNIPPNIGGESNWFLAEFGVTNGSEINDALINGKAVALVYDNAVYTLSRYVTTTTTGTTYFFDRISGNIASEIAVNGSTWTDPVNTTLSSGTYYVTQGVTTAQDIEDALEEEKVVTLLLQNRVFYLAFITAEPDGTKYTFKSFGASVTFKNGSWSSVEYDTQEESDGLVIYNFEATEEDGVYTIEDAPSFGQVLNEVADIFGNTSSQKMMAVASVVVDGDTYVLPLVEYKTGNDASLRFAANIDDVTVLVLNGSAQQIATDAWEILRESALEDAQLELETVCGYRENLTTTAKSNLVAAINEVNAIAGGSGLPSGGTAGQFLVKQSSTDGDAAWVTVPSANGVNF